MSNVSFPAEFLSAHDIGHRIQVITVDGAKITDELNMIKTYTGADRKTVLLLNFKNTMSPRAMTHAGPQGFEVALKQFVKRIVE